MDVSYYNIGTAIKIIWFQVAFCLTLAYILMDITPEVSIVMVLMSGAITCVAASVIGPGLRHPPPSPVRFNRQRREVCILRKDGDYWIIPWEKVTATVQHSSTTTQGGKISQGFLIIDFNNPAPSDGINDSHQLLFNCGDVSTGASLWECIRTYMEVGPHAVSDNSSRFNRPKGIFASYLDDLKEAAERKGWILTLIWDVFFGLVFFNVLLADYLERKKLYPLPDLDHPDIIEWSKPLPPEQWANPSAEFQAALAEYEARRV